MTEYTVRDLLGAIRILLRQGKVEELSKWIEELEPKLSKDTRNTRVSMDDCCDEWPYYCGPTCKPLSDAVRQQGVPQAKLKS